MRLDEIARAARASLQTIYRHYGDKQALLDACVLNWANALAARMTDHLVGIETYKDRLRKVFWVVLDFFEQHPKVARMILGSVYPGAMRRDVTDQQRRLTNLFLEVLAEGRERGILNDQVSETILLDYFYGVLARLIQMQSLRQQEPPLTDQVNVLFDMLWRAIAKP
ncbi:TetR family transcriptional regulator [Salinisphaera sp. C84B14]